MAEILLDARGQAERLRAVFNRSAVPMVMVDDARRHVGVNRPAQLMARLSLAELRGSTLDDLTPPEGLPALEALWARLLDTGWVSGPREVAGRNGSPLEVFYWGMANALPGQHLIAYAPADWSEDELGVMEAKSREPPLVPLTPREREVLQLAGEGFSGPRIAEQLVVSPMTVKTHFSNIYEKLGVSSRAAAVATGMRLGLIA
jgi:PAS domain S-box-containing protein